MAGGTSFDINLGVSGGSAAESAAATVDRLAGTLENAKTAADAAAAAVKAGEQAYAASEAAADRAAKALEKINIAADANRTKMQAALEAGDEAKFWKLAGAANKLADQQAKASTAADAAKKALAGEAEALDHLKGAAADATKNVNKVTTAHDAAKKAATAVQKATEAAAGSGKVNELAESFGKLGGPLGQLGTKAFGAADGVKKLFGAAGAGVGPYVALAVAVVAVTTALIAGTVAMVKWSIGLSDANRSAQLLSDGIAGSVAGGRELDAAINDLEKRVPQTSDELKSMAADLAKTGLKGQALTDALEDAATKAAALKWGPDFAKGANTLDKLTARLTKHIAGLFGGLDIEGFLGGFAKVVDMFDQTTVTGKAIKVVFESLFQPLVDGLADLAPLIVKTFIQFEIWVLKALIAIKPFGSTILLVGKIFGGVVAGVVIAGVALVGILAGIGVAVTAVTAGFIYLGSQMIGVGVSVAKFAYMLVTEPGKALDFLVQKFHEAMNWLESLDFAAIGKSMIDGLIGGILSGGSSLLSSVTGVVGGAIDAAKKALGIASPSKVFAEIGMQTAEGMAGGVEGGTSGVQSSLESMVSPTDSASSGGAAPSSGGGNSYVINITAPDGEAGSIASEVRAVLLELLDGDAVQVGAEVPA